MDISRKRFGRPVSIRDGHDNFFTPLRLLFALLVVIGHAYAVGKGSPDAEPQLFLSYTFSYMAVNLFFITSGFLVTKSMLYRGDPTLFTASRLIRIYPALIVHVLFVVFIVGTFMSDLPLRAYLSHPDVLSQPIRVLSFFNTDMILPGVFADNGEPYASAPLWTLRFEMLCYIGTVLAFTLGLMRRKWMLLAQFVVPSIIWIVGQQFGTFEHLPASLENMIRFAIAYGLGTAIYAYRDRITVSLWMIPALALLCWLIRDIEAVEVTMNLMLAAFVMWAAFLHAPRFDALKRLPDMSYGLYIYHWVILQTAMALWPGLSVIALFAIALPITLGLAWLSWIWIEKPALARKGPFSDWLRFGREPKPFDRNAVLID